LLWSLACVLFALFVVTRAKERSGLSWADFFLLRGAFLYCRFLHRWSANRFNPFPSRGPALIYCNHTCSADATFLLAASDRTISFLVAREHFQVHPVAYRILKHMRCVPVMRDGADPAALRQAISRLKAGHLVCLFPEGNLSGVGLGRWRHAKPGLAYLALMSRLPVYPVLIQGGPRTDQLLNSWVLPTRQAVHVIFGPPVDLQVYYDRPRTRMLIEEVGEFLMAKVGELGRDETERMRDEG
jgi:1-acyl-sn-glycerol-3-phosphate acyltransferase